MNRIAIVANNKPETQKVRQKLEEKIEQNEKLEIDNEHPDAVVSIGGDGTLISAFHKYNNLVDKISFMGIHTGHLGFYTWHSLTMDEIVNNLSKDEIPSVADPLLEVTITLQNEEQNKFVALNEVTFRRIAQSLKSKIYIDGQFFEYFNGDGICVSTPTGSTAYNKSLGGSIVSPYLKAISMSEMASINNRVYRTISSPIVIGQQESIMVRPQGEHRDFVGVDGAEFRHTVPIKEIKYQVSPHSINFIRFRNPQFWRRVRQSFISGEVE